MPTTGSPKKTSTSDSKAMWTDEERAAAQAAVKERQAASGRSPADDRAAGLQDLKDSIAKMPSDDRAIPPVL